MIPSQYEINIAKAEGTGWNGAPKYVWFCKIDAGTNCNHAQAVAEEIRKAFPAPDYDVSLYQRYECAKPVDVFDWRVGAC